MGAEGLSAPKEESPIQTRIEELNRIAQQADDLEDWNDQYAALEERDRLQAQLDGLGEHRID